MTPEEDRMGFTPEGWDELMKQSPVVNKDLSEQHPQFGKHDPYLAQTREMGFEDIMNEHEAGGRWRDYCNRRGMATQLENAASTSVPDCIFMCEGYIGFMEIKKLYGKYIYGPIYQGAYAQRASHHIHDWQHHYVVYEPDFFKVYTYKQIKGCPNVGRGNKVRYDVSNLKPVFQVEDDAKFDEFIKYLMKKAFD